jgi:hypothetical protein
LFTNFTINLINAQCRSTYNIYWEQVSDSVKNETIASSEVDINAVNYYKENFQFTDDERSLRLLKVLISEPENENIKALYFYLFNRICIRGDGAATEGLGNSCQKIMINDPVYVLNYFSSHNIIMKSYAELLGYELYCKEKKISDIKYNFNDFKKIINDKLKSDANLNSAFSYILKKTFNIFNSEIEKVIKSMD